MPGLANPPRRPGQRPGEPGRSTGVTYNYRIQKFGLTNHPPDCSGAVASDPTLSPPNHKYRAISIEGVTDPDGDPVTIKVTGVMQDEPLNGKGDGNTCPVARIDPNGNVSARAERGEMPHHGRNGRVYEISFTATDSHGATCDVTVRVCVPRDKKTPDCIGDALTFNSLGLCSKGHGLDAEEVSLDVRDVTETEAEFTFALPADGHVDISVFDLTGRRVATIENGQQRRVRPRLEGWTASRRAFVRMHVGEVTVTQRVLKLR